MRKFNIRNPETQNELTEPEEFNLMFQSSIGPTGHIKGCVFFFFPLLSNLNHPGVLIREVTNSGPLRFFFLQFPPTRDCPGSLCQLFPSARVQQRSCSVRLGPDWSVVPKRDRPPARSP